MEARAQALAVRVTVSRSIALDNVNVNDLEAMAWDVAQEFYAQVLRALQETYQREHGHQLRHGP